MKQVVYHSKDWYCLCLLLAKALLEEGNAEDAMNYALKLERAELPLSAQRDYHTFLAAIAQLKNDYEVMIEQLVNAKAADRLLDEPSHQFDLTKQIVIALDHLGRYSEAIVHWELLLEDFENFHHSEHQPQLATKFLSQLLLKVNQNEKAAAVRARWVQLRVQSRIAESRTYFKSSAPPENYHDELTNFIERTRQNTFIFYTSEPSLVSDLNLRIAQFWVGADSMRIKLADLLDDSASEILSDKDQLPYFFFMRSISTYLTSIELATSGRIPEAFGTLRMCMENALYAFHLSQQPADAVLWLDRPTLALSEIDSVKKAKRKAIGLAFSPTAIINNISSQNEALGDACRFYYEMSIDEGAHSNVNIFRRQASQKTTDDAAYIFGVEFLNQESSAQCCRTILEVSESVLDVFRLAGWIW